MDESRLKQILDVTLMSDAPLMALGGARLESIREGLKPTVPHYIGAKDPELNEWLSSLRREEESMRDTYARIDVSRLDEETGKSIVSECQPLVQEFYDQYFVLLDKYVASGFQAQEVPQRLFEIRDRVMGLSDEFQKLKAYKLYRETAWKVGYFSHECESRTAWFIAGKPTEIHPEKLAEVLASEPEN
ncbi:hypothetical protein KY360_05245 [Candidatus Woesearchaeota archaeon]|nr:hypothetical protein [Candidatus Woesearchaeota archaeon]